MTRIFHRFPATSLPTAVRGEGACLYDSAGKRYLDASGGAAVSILGHAHPHVLQAMHQQIDRLTFAHTYFFTNEPAERLAGMLTSNAPAGLDKVYFLSGGSEANEAALKLARQYHVACGEPDRDQFIYRRQSYHGNTLGALSVSGNPRRRGIYEPMLMPARAIPPCYAYRLQKDGESEADYGRRAADELETAICEIGEGRIAAFIAEPVVGAALGAVPAVEGYLQRIQAICRRYGVLLILDEVMCGMGRSGELFAASAFGVEPDIITIAKGLGAGYQPIGALLAHARIYERVTAEGGHFVHGHTYIGHPVACAAALAVQQVLQEQGLLARVGPLGLQVRAALDARFGSHPHVGDIRGKGLLLAMELVEDRNTKKPFPAAKGVAKACKAAAMDHGLICYPGAGTADGTSGDHILIAPPYIFSDAQIAEMVDKLEATLTDVLGA